MKHAKQFYLVDNNYMLDSKIKGFESISFEYFTLFYNSDLAIHKLRDGSIFLGCVFNNEDDFEGLNPKTFLDKCDHLGGRWVYISDDYIFTDFLATKSIYYTKECNVISSSLGVLIDLKEIDGNELTYSSFYQAFIPPSTQYENINQLLPGEYVALKSRKLISHGSNYFDVNNFNDESSSLKSMTELMKSYVESCHEKIVEKGYYQGLTGGVDSRLTLSSFLMSEKEKSTLTHSKPYLFMTKSDSEIPKLLSNKFSFKHIVTHREKIKFNTNDYLLHVGRSVDSQIGSNLYYFSNGQMECFKNKYFVDNYYEVGAKWLHGIGETGKNKKLTLDSIKKDKLNIKDEDLDYFLKHLKNISGDNIDHRDTLYFLKNFSNVSQLFCELDYYMFPIVHMNSRRFFSELLSTPESLRDGKVFIKRLINKNISELDGIDFNRKDSLIKNVAFKVYVKTMRLMKSFR